MREAELISRIVSAQEINPDHGLLAPEYFRAFPEVWNFVASYYQTNSALPNKQTLMTQFADFPFEHTENTAQWLADELQQEFCEFKLRADLAHVTDLVVVNPRSAMRTLLDLTASYMPHLGDSIGGYSDLVATVFGRIDEVARRRAIDGLSGITSGFDLLDEVTSGTQRGEIEIWFGRPGEGKSLALLFGAFAAIRVGKRVTYISPEMDAFETGLRLDAFAMHTSASAYISGKMSDRAFDDMRDGALAMLKRSETWAQLRFREPTGIGRRFTTSDIARIIKIDEPDLVTIDGLMFVEPMRVERDPRKRIINIMEELKTLVVTTGVPIRLAHQANRKSEIESSKNRSKLISIDEMLPELQHMAESDSVGQFCNRAIAIRRINDTMYLALRKNRSNENGRIVSATIDIDHGQFSNMQIENTIKPEQQDFSARRNTASSTF